MFLYTLMSPSFYARAAKISLVIFISCLLLYTIFFCYGLERKRAAYCIGEGVQVSHR